MKVITKCVMIEDQKFFLIEDQHEGRKFWGTIPYSEVGSDGRLLRVLNGIQMRISWEGAGDALNNRRIDVALGRMLEGFKAQGMDIYEAMAAMVATDEYKALYA